MKIVILICLWLRNSTHSPSPNVIKTKGSLNNTNIILKQVTFDLQKVPLWIIDLLDQCRFSNDIFEKGIISILSAACQFINHLTILLLANQIPKRETKKRGCGWGMNWWVIHSFCNYLLRQHWQNYSHCYWGSVDVAILGLWA